MPATAVYDLVSFDHQNLSGKHYGARPGTMLNVRPKQQQKAPKIMYSSCSDSEDDALYESLEQINYRKSIENKSRQAKISAVKRTGHPLFDSLREERALKPLKEKQPAKINEQKGKNVKSSEYLNTIQKMKLYADPKSLKKNKNNSENMHQTYNPKYHSLQQLDVPDKNKNYRKMSEHHMSQTLPKQLNLSRRAMAKSEQNLMSLHPNYIQRPPPNFQFAPPHPQFVNPHFMNPHMNPMSMKRQVPQKKIAHRQPFPESSDSESEWMVIPRPKLSQIRVGKPRSSDDSDNSGNPMR